MLLTKTSGLLPREQELARFEYRESQSLRLAFGGCALSLVLCLVMPFVIQKSARSTDTRLHPGKVLRSALPDEGRDGEHISLGMGVPVVHDLLHAHSGEHVTPPQVTPIPSVLCVRPATDRAPPAS
jgi:hypothetical protein